MAMADILVVLHEIEATHGDSYTALPDSHPDIRRLHVAAGVKENPGSHFTVYWTEERKTELQRLYAEGMGIRKIARHFKKSNEAITQQLNHMGISTRKPQGKPVIMLTKEGNVLREFPNTTAAEQETGIRSIWHCLKGKTQTAGGFKWKYADEVSG